jgi:hypothetical protein
MEVCSMIVRKAAALLILGMIFFASLFYISSLPPYVTGLERFVYEMIPLVIVMFMLYIILY